MSLVIGGLVKSETGALADFDTAQLEAELVRRKRRRADTDPTTRPTVTDPISGHSVETAIKLEDSDSDEEIESQIQHLSNSEIKNERDSDSGGEHERKNDRVPPPPPPPSRRTRTTHLRGPKEPPPALYKAHIKSLADAGTARVTSSTSDMDNGIMQRIKKCLDRAFHPSTPAAEGKAALYLASRLMGQYNVTQAEVLAHEPSTTQRQYGGQSVVSLRRTDGDGSKGVRQQAYVYPVCVAMSTFFDCEYFSAEQYSSLELTFYGIAENTVVAAMSFEMAYNLISEWARHQKGVGPKNSYCLGASEELERMAKREKAAEEAKAKETEEEALAAKVKQEELERQAEINRLAAHPKIANERASPGPTEEANISQVNDEESPTCDDARSTMPSDATPIGDDDETDEGDGDCIEPDFTVRNEHSLDLEANLDDEIKMYIKPDPQCSDEAPEPAWFPLSPSHREASSNPQQEIIPSASTSTIFDSNQPSNPEDEMESKWASRMQLMTFRSNAAQIAEKYIEDKGIKISHFRPRSNVIRDPTAYQRGVNDGKKIDVHRKRLKQKE